MGALADQLSQFQKSGVGVAPSAAELATPLIAQAEQCHYPSAVLYQADWRTLADGMARHAREQALALASSGIPVKLRAASIAGPQRDEDLDPTVERGVGYLTRVTSDTVPVVIRQAVIHSAEFLWNLILPRGARLAGLSHERNVLDATIVYTSWERSTVDRDVVDHLNQCGQVWVPCLANYNAFLDDGVDEDKLRVVPYPYQPSESPACAISEPRGSGTVPRGKKFYNIGKWEPRKGQHWLIGAFLTGFTPKDRASLFIKTHGWGEWDNYPTVTESVHQWLADPRAIANGWTKKDFARLVRIATSHMPEDELNALHRTNNIYVSAGHGEGWDLPAFDAVCAGNRLVHVGYGGSEDYAPKDAIGVPYQLGPVHPGYRWEPSAQWGHYRLEDLAGAMREATAPKQRMHPAYLYGQYGRAAVGELMKSNVRDVLTRCDPSLATWKALVDGGGFG